MVGGGGDIFYQLPPLLGSLTPSCKNLDRQERDSPWYNLIFKFCLCVFSFQFTNFEQLFLETGNSINVLSMMFNILQLGCSQKMLTHQMPLTKSLLL